MTREQAKQLEANPVWKGWRDERKVMQHLRSDKQWMDCTDPFHAEFLEYPERYRLKPEPRRVWINIYKDLSGKNTSGEKFNGYAYDNEAGAYAGAGQYLSEVAVEFVEVLK